MSVGNDIVDLAAAGEPSARWRARALHPGEGGGDARRVWSLWAAKEAAYKLLARSRPGLGFAPRRFVVDLDRARVCVDAQTLPLTLRTGPEHVLALVWRPGESPPAWGYARGDRSDPREESRAVRSGACAHAGRLLGGRWTIVREGGAPRLVRQGEERDVSLSHHGRFVAWAFPGRAQPV